MYCHRIKRIVIATALGISLAAAGLVGLNPSPLTREALALKAPPLTREALALKAPPLT
jgi:hypothetical protein